MTTVDQHVAASVLRTAFDKVVTSQVEAIVAGAEVVAAAVQRGGIIHAFGTGHSKAIVLELVGRAGGLVPANALAIKDLVMYGGAEPEEILDPTCERDPALARRILDLADVRPEDVFIIVSNSGGNGAIVEMARLASDLGNQVIAITSLEHSTHIESRHPSGARLFELADVVIDNGAPSGDAALELPDGAAITPPSTLTGVVIAQLLTAEVCGRLLRDGADVPVLTSVNVPEGDARNAMLRKRYESRIRRSEP